MTIRRVVPVVVPGCSLAGYLTPALVRPAGDGARAATAGRLLSPPGLAAITLGFVALFCAACVSVQPATQPDAEDATHAHGKDLYERKCGTCHDLFDPSEFDCDSWTVNVKRYAGRAHLAAADRPAVIAYLHAHASDAK